VKGLILKDIFNSHVAFGRGHHCQGSNHANHYSA
jgi:hypothetical protein